MQQPRTKAVLMKALRRQYAGPLTQVALSAMSAWLIVLGLKGLAGFTVNQHTALADLLGIVLVIGAIRLFSQKRK
jgi:hypothetical protein